MGVVKANAYGHGDLAVAKVIEEEVDVLGVAIIDEAIALREDGIQCPIHILGLTPREEMKHLFSYHLTPTISRFDELDSLSQLASSFDQKIHAHLKVDTGMGRIGVLPEDAPSFLEEAEKRPGVTIEGVMSHCSCADSDPIFTRKQYELFMEATALYKGKKHLANSATLLREREYDLDMVRPGLILYGLYPSEEMEEEKKIDLKRALTWKTMIIHTKSLPPGCPISYASTYHTTKEETVVATLPVGYEDGYLRALSNKGEVLVRGKRAPVIGNICMDQIMVDVTEIEGAQVGDEVVLLGEQGEEKITALEMAQWIGTINYEVMTNISKRAPRDYKS